MTFAQDDWKATLSRIFGFFLLALLAPILLTISLNLGLALRGESPWNVALAFSLVAISASLGIGFAAFYNLWRYPDIVLGEGVLILKVFIFTIPSPIIQ